MDIKIFAGVLFTRIAAIHKKWNDITKEEMQQKKQGQEIMIMNAEGADVRNITSDQTEEFNPSWSGDGKIIYYLTKQDTSLILYQVKQNKGNAEALTSLSGEISV